MDLKLIDVLNIPSRGRTEEHVDFLETQTKYIKFFRELSEQLGEMETQLLIRGCAEGARSCVRRSDVLARLEENRFAMLIGEANEFAATAVADRVRRTLRRLPLPDEATLTISCGLSPHTAGTDAVSWEARSAQALESAVSEGGNRTVVVSAQH